MTFIYSQSSIKVYNKVEGKGKLTTLNLDITITDDCH